MRRLWFKEEMKAAILAGSKTATTRTKALKVGEKFQAVSGSRFKAQPFAVLNITSRRQIDDLTLHCARHFRQEGFKSANSMGVYIAQNLPKYLTVRPLYYHTFKEIFAAPAGATPPSSPKDARRRRIFPYRYPRVYRTIDRKGPIWNRTQNQSDAIWSMDLPEPHYYIRMRPDPNKESPPHTELEYYLPERFPR